MRARLIKDVQAIGTVTLNETLEKTIGKEWRGKPIRGYTTSSKHVGTLSYGHKNSPGLLAEELCTHGTSRGPDWVNEKEGKFCKMSDKTLWPVCQRNMRGGKVSDNCFDMSMKQLIIGGSKSFATNPTLHEPTFRTPAQEVMDRSSANDEPLSEATRDTPYTREVHYGKD